MTDACVTVEVTPDGAGLVSHVGCALLGQVADRLGLTRALSRRLGAFKQRRRGHDPVALSVLHVAARLAFSGRRAKLHLPASWPWTEALTVAFEKLSTLPASG